MLFFPFPKKKTSLNFQVKAWAMSERLCPRAFLWKMVKAVGTRLLCEAWHQATFDEPSFSHPKGFILRNGE